MIPAAGLIPATKPFLGLLQSVEKVLYETEDESTIQEIRVPSVSELCETAASEEGIRNIAYVDGTCFLPVITLSFDTEVILRNLVAYEKLMAKNNMMGGFGLELTEYVDFMCGIIDSAADVKMLREQKIMMQIVYP